MKKNFYISLIVILGGLLFFASTDAVSAQLNITSSSPLPRGTQNQPYPPFQFQASGAESYTWLSLPAGAGVSPTACGSDTQRDGLPLGLNLDPDGLFSGTPTISGNFAFRVDINNSYQKPFCITIDPSQSGAPPGTPPAPPPSTPGPAPTQPVKQPRSSCPTVGLVPCGTDGCPCEFCDIFVLTNNVIRWTFTWAIPTIAILMLIIGGVLLFFAGAKSDAVNQAKGIITSVIVGLLIILASWVIINTVFDKIGIINMPGWKWYEVGCSI